MSGLASAEGRVGSEMLSIEDANTSRSPCFRGKGVRVRVRVRVGVRVRVRGRTRR